MLSHFIFNIKSKIKSKKMDAILREKIIEYIKSELDKNNECNLLGIFVIRRVVRKPYVARNPKTGKSVIVNERSTLKVRALGKLRVNT